MSLVTRCPSCTTAFRVSAQQLQAHHGDVRCGRCATVFNAFESLATLPVTAAPEAAPAAAPEVPPQAEEQLHAAAAETELLAQLQPQPAGVRWGWLAASLPLALLLAGQLAYEYRSDIAVAAPPAKPWLEQGCAWLGCTVPLPQKAELLSIESSDLQADPDQPGVMTLSAVLRNRAVFAQAWPALELTLTDTQDRALARRSFRPGEYLPHDAEPAAGMAPNREASLRLALETIELRPAGYRLYLYYP